MKGTTDLPEYDPVGEPELFLHIGMIDIDRTYSV